jgi:hypothetical protein
MGPVDIFFLILVAIWGAIGIVRGYHRELGVTLLLFVGLFVIIFAEAMFPNQVAKFLQFIAGPDPSRQAALQAFFCCGFLIFISLQVPRHDKQFVSLLVSRTAQRLLACWEPLVLPCTGPVAFECGTATLQPALQRHLPDTAAGYLQVAVSDTADRHYDRSPGDQMITHVRGESRRSREQERA